MKKFSLLLLTLTFGLMAMSFAPHGVIEQDAPVSYDFLFYIRLMELKNEFDGRKGAYYFDQDGQRMGESTYTMAGPDKLIIDHTEVDDSLQGTGKAAELVQAIVDHARENQL